MYTVQYSIVWGGVLYVSICYLLTDPDKNIWIRLNPALEKHRDPTWSGSAAQSSTYIKIKKEVQIERKFKITLIYKTNMKKYLQYTMKSEKDRPIPEMLSMC